MIIFTGVKLLVFNPESQLKVLNIDIYRKLNITTKTRTLNIFVLTLYLTMSYPIGCEQHSLS